MKKIILIMIAILATGCSAVVEDVITINEPLRTISYHGGEMEVEIEANCAFVVGTADEWLEASYTQGDDVVTVTVAPNDEAEMRRGVVELIAVGVRTGFVIEQEGKDNLFE